MNRFLFIMMLLPAGNALAQKQSLPNAPFSQDQPTFKTQVLITDTIKPNLRALLDRKSTIDWLAQGKRSHVTPYGPVYLMPIDQMPCIVPDKKKNASMPTMRTKPANQMPNGFLPPRVKLNKE